MWVIRPRRFATGVLNELGRPRGYLTIIAFGVASQLPYYLPSEYVHLLILTFIIGTAAIAWNIIGGFGGQFSLGNGVFFGICGYSIGILLVRFETGFFLAFTIGVTLALIAAIIIGYPSFKLTGHYFALATITVVAGFEFLARYFQDLTGGGQGLSLVPATVTGLAPLNLARASYYQVAFLLFAMAFLVSIWVRRTKLGYYLMALRDDQLAAASLGINVTRYKMYGWLTSAALTALAGAMYVTYVQFLDPAYMFSITQSVLFAVIPIIGGIGTITGPVVGTFLVVPLQEIAISQFGGRFGAITYVVYGILLILLIIYAPEGLVPKFHSTVKEATNHLPRFTFGQDDIKTKESD